MRIQKAAKQKKARHHYNSKVAGDVSSALYDSHDDWSDQKEDCKIKSCDNNVRVCFKIHLIICEDFVDRGSDECIQQFHIIELMQSRTNRIMEMKSNYYRHTV